MAGKESVYIILIASVALTILAGGIAVVISLSKKIISEKENKIRLIEKERQVELLTATARAEENQKVELANKLHDDLLPLVNNAQRNIPGLLAEIESNGASLGKLREELSMLPVLEESIRNVIHEIVPKLFTSFGLLKAIEAFIKQMNRDRSTVAEFHNGTTFAGELPLSFDKQLLIFKVCREVLHNLQNHAKYEYLNISLEEVNPNFTLLFSHDGKRITNEEIDELRQNSSGMGLKLIETRLLLLNGTLDYSWDGEASYIRLTVPITQ